jgi:hypothetical protein
MDGSRRVCDRTLCIWVLASSLACKVACKSLAQPCAHAFASQGWAGELLVCVIQVVIGWFPIGLDIRCGGCKLSLFICVAGTTTVAG